MTILSTLAIILIILGFIGTILPFLPGVFFIFLGSLLYSGVHGFVEPNSAVLIILLGLAILAFFLDLFAAYIGAKKAGATKSGRRGALIGSLVGFVIGRFWAIMLGPLLGAVGAEKMSGRTWLQSLTAGFGAFLGFVAGLTLQILIGGIMLVIFFTNL
ncbi:DUF456 domain-containing protein [Patescibacteria group bacterium]